jgi:hypothetical protein
VHDYLVAHPEILLEVSNQLDRQQAGVADKARKDALASVGIAGLTDPKIAYVAGPKDAKVTVAGVFDYRCPHCKASQAAMEHLLKRAATSASPSSSGHPDAGFALGRSGRSGSTPSGRQICPVPFCAHGNGPANCEGPHSRHRQERGLDTDKLAKDMADPAVLDSIKQSNALPTNCTLTARRLS